MGQFAGEEGGKRFARAPAQLTTQASVSVTTQVGQFASEEGASSLARGRAQLSTLSPQKITAHSEDFKAVTRGCFAPSA